MPEENKNLESLLQENLRLTREIRELAEKTRRYLLFSQIFSVVKIILIIGPLILALIYLPPLLKAAVKSYGEILGGGTGDTLINSSNILKNYLGD